MNTPAKQADIQFWRIFIKNEHGEGRRVTYVVNQIGEIWLIRSTADTKDKEKIILDQLHILTPRKQTIERLQHRYKLSLPARKWWAIHMGPDAPYYSFTMLQDTSSNFWVLQHHLASTHVFPAQWYQVKSTTPRVLPLARIDQLKWMLVDPLSRKYTTDTAGRKYAQICMPKRSAQERQQRDKRAFKRCSSRLKGLYFFQTTRDRYVMTEDKTMWLLYTTTVINGAYFLEKVKKLPSNLQYISPVTVVKYPVLMRIVHNKRSLMSPRNRFTCARIKKK